MSRRLSIYLVTPGVCLWVAGVCRAIYLHKMRQGWRIEYVRYTQPE